MDIHNLKEFYAMLEMSVEGAENTKNGWKWNVFRQIFENSS